MILRTVPVLLCLISLAGPASAREDDFVELKRLDPTLAIELPYATEENFTKERLYPVARCFLRRKVAESLVAAHRSLADRGLGLKIWDGYRPHSVQYRMWEKAPFPGYVGDPKFGSKHNRGAAVDVTLVERNTGKELAMPTPYDEFTPRAHRDYFKLPPEVAANRGILQDAMRAHGFLTIESEWWHFDHREWSRFPLSDVSLETLAARSDREAAATGRTANEDSWPRFRGPNGGGVSAGDGVPLHWSATENLKWKTPLPGPGSSSPVVWGGRVFVTCYSGYGTGTAGATPEDLVRHLVCLDLATGRILWTADEPAVHPEDVYEGFLPEHGYASSTPATDGARVYCFFGKSGVAAFDFDGKKLWSAPTGTKSSAMTWGSAASVVAHDGVVVVNAGDEARALLAFDAATGREVWRMEHPMLEQTYASPVLAAKHLLATSRTAGTFVIETGPVFKLFGVNRIEGDPTRFQGTPAVAGGILLLRSEEALCAIGK